MKLKLDADGHVVVQDGKPVYVNDSGAEIAFDYPETLKTISRLNGEAKTRRDESEGLKDQLKSFEGIDPEGAKKALETIKNLGDKQLIDAGEVERVKQEAKSGFDEQLKAQQKKYQPIIEERDSLRVSLDDMKLSNAFDRSKFVQDKLAIPVDLAQAKFRQSFFIDDGKIRAKGPDGNTLYSRANPGNLAEFDEAMELLVEGYAFRDSILKGTGASGGGASSSANAGGKRSITRAAFSALAPADQMKTAKEVQIVD